MPAPTASRYLIVNAYSSRNAGDAAIVLATVAVLRDHGAEEVVSATRYHAEDVDYYAAHGIQIAPPIISFPPRGSASGAKRALTLAWGLLIATIVVLLHRARPRLGREAARRLKGGGVAALLDTDRVIVCGGGYMFSAKQSVNLTLIHALATVKLGSLARKRPLMMPQSIGPLPKRLDRWLVRRALASVSPIVVRDRLAEREARSTLRRGRHRIELCPDIAFYGWPARGTAQNGAKPSGSAIGIVVMDWTWARGVDRGKALGTYVRKLADVAMDLSSRGYSVTLFGHARIPEQDQDDTAVARQVEAELRRRSAAGSVAVSEVGSDADELRRRFAALDVVVGTRLHSCIIALTAGTPAIGLAYQPKTVGAYELLGLEELCFDVDSFDAGSLVEVVAEVAGDGGGRREQVLEAVHSLRTRIQGYYRRQLSEDS